jgi:hypothetical protein
MLDLAAWSPLEVPWTGELRDADPTAARAVFEALMSARPLRLAGFEALAARHGVDLAAADATDRVGAWLVEAAGAAGPAAVGTPTWTGLAADAALWLGERVIAATGVRWELYTAHKKATGYQRAVLVGFAGVDDPRYYVDIAHFVGRWVELALRRRAARPDFLTTIAASALADAGRR